MGRQGRREFEHSCLSSQCTSRREGPGGRSYADAAARSNCPTDKNEFPRENSRYTRRSRRSQLLNHKSARAAEGIGPFECQPIYRSRNAMMNHSRSVIYVAMIVMLGVIIFAAMKEAPPILLAVGLIGEIILVATAHLSTMIECHGMPGPGHPQNLCSTSQND